MQDKNTIAALRRDFISGSRTPLTVFDECIDVIKKDESVRAFIDVFEDAREEAATASEKYALLKEKAPPLLGIPIAVKNNILIRGRRATAASKMLENYISPYDATVVTRLKDAGALLIGSTNLDEFAMGSSTEHSAFGVTANPHDYARVPGGSSGGSAAAVAMGAAIGALGTDTGGSVRLPGSYCGVVGMKPTYGKISRNGLIAMGSSLDQAGPLAATVTDAEEIFNVIAGQDELDSTMYRDGAYPAVPKKERYTIGIPRDFLKKGIESDVLAVFERSLERLAEAGHEVMDVSLPNMEKGLAAYYIVMPAEVSSNLARYDGVRYGLHVGGHAESLLADYELTRAEGFGSEVKRRILLGTYVLSSGYYDAYYGKAEQTRSLMREELASVYQKVDVILTPTAPTPAFKIGEKSDPLSMYLADIFTVPANLTGVPAMSVPAGNVVRDGKDLPVGVQFMVPHDGEERLFDIGKKFLGE